MGRWQPGAQERLRRAALDLFGEQGFDATSVAQITERAGVTERTFFRHFADKREVLFAGEGEFEQPFLDAVADAPAGTGHLDLVAAALDAACAAFEAWRTRDEARARQRILDAHAGLRERELLKLDHLACSLAGALRERGATALRARLAGDLAVSVFVAAFTRWTAEDAAGDGPGLRELAREALAQVRDLVVAPPSA
ncbi:TetR family transcriptional regulator [Kineococcus terrestris]|uniref:TetR family transcriptional regulator n=1 Tax=Kineococcus terrestris TaxID=2044856 RepID=UPI0034DAC3FC